MPLQEVTLEVSLMDILQVASQERATTGSHSHTVNLHQTYLQQWKATNCWQEDPKIISSTAHKALGECHL